MLVILSPSKGSLSTSVHLVRLSISIVKFIVGGFYIFIRAGYGSESEGDEEAATVTLSSDLGRVNKGSTKSAVKLQEIGPRITIHLFIVDEGFCSV